MNTPLINNSDQGNENNVCDCLHEFLINQDLSELTKNHRKTKNQAITISIKCVYPDPSNPESMNQVIGSQTCNSTDKVEYVVKKFLDTYTEIPKNRKYYLGYDELLFREGTLADCGITHGKSVELYAPGKNAAAYHNEGLTLILWALIPFIIGFAALIFAITAEGIENDFQALFLFIGFLLDIPSIIIIGIGLILLPTCPMPCYFVGTQWI